jgi:hypothetical protein
MIASDPMLAHSRVPVLLTISTDALILKRLNDGQILHSHKMEGISFASAGEHVRIRSVVRSVKTISRTWM